MACQIHAPASHSHPKTHEDADQQAADDAVTQAAQRATSDVTVDDADDWLTEIDEALEENGSTSELAAAFVAAYLQKGGQ